MANQYYNFITKLNSLQMNVTSTVQDFDEKNLIEFKCGKGHINSLSKNSFVNKTAPATFAKMSSICTVCNGLLTYVDDIKLVCANLNFEFIDFNKSETNPDSKVVTYKCHCGNISQTDWRNLKKKDRKSNCPKCQNNTKKVNFEDINKFFADNDCKLLTQSDDYKNNKQKLDYICSCGNQSQIVYMDFKLGKRCMKCRYKK